MREMLAIKHLIAGEPQVGLTIKFFEIAAREEDGGVGLEVGVALQASLRIVKGFDIGSAIIDPLVEDVAAMDVAFDFHSRLGAIVRRFLCAMGFRLRHARFSSALMDDAD